MYKPPKSLATCADLLYTMRAERLEIKKRVDALAEKEAIIREYLISNLPKSQASGIAGKVAVVKIDIKSVVQVTDWDKMYDYVVKNRKKGAFALLQRRINDSAVRDVWDSGKEVPGCAVLNIPVVSCTKL